MNQCETLRFMLFILDDFRKRKDSSTHEAAVSSGLFLKALPW